MLEFFSCTNIGRSAPIFPATSALQSALKNSSRSLTLTDLFLIYPRRLSSMLTVDSLTLNLVTLRMATIIFLRRSNE
jgi:hypothetical protein